MTFKKRASLFWLGMSSAKRQELLQKLDEVNPKAFARLNKSIQDMSAISQFNELPIILRGQLLMAVTDEGFSSSVMKERQEAIKRSIFPETEH